MCMKIYFLFHKSEAKDIAKKMCRVSYKHIAEMTHVIEHCRLQTITGNKSERAISIFFFFWKKITFSYPLMIFKYINRLNNIYLKRFQNFCIILRRFRFFWPMIRNFILATRRYNIRVYMHVRRRTRKEKKK